MATFQMDMRPEACPLVRNNTLKKGYDTINVLSPCHHPHFGWPPQLSATQRKIIATHHNRCHCHNLALPL
jgi:hypothetical protein